MVLKEEPVDEGTAFKAAEDDEEPVTKEPTAAAADHGHGHSHGGEACHGHGAAPAGGAPATRAPQTKEMWVSAYSYILQQLMAVSQQLKQYEMAEMAKVEAGQFTREDLVQALRKELADALSLIERQVYGSLGWSDAVVIEMQKKFSEEPEIVQLIVRIFFFLWMFNFF